MKSLQRSIATIDTHHPTHTTIHNCPTCRCKSTELSLKLTHTNSQPSLAPTLEQNLYLSTHLTQAQSERHFSKPYQSTIFQKPTKITFKFAPASPKPTNVSFSYTSPPKTRKHHSSEGRFSTRRFKNTHFPQISRQEESVNVKKIGEEKQNRQNSPYCEIQTGEETPQKPRILKMKKEKAKQKLEITLSKKSSSRQSIKDDISARNDYELKGPKPSPINGIWIHSIQHIHKDTCNSPRSIPAGSTQQIHYQTQSRVVAQSHVSPPSSQQILVPTSVPSQKPFIHKKYPTIESIDAFQTRMCVQNVPQKVYTNFTREETSLRLGRQSKQSSAGRSGSVGAIAELGSGLRSEQLAVLRASQQEMAVSLSEQLQLHYDYYYPQEESDQSLSIHVTL